MGQKVFFLIFSFVMMLQPSAAQEVTVGQSNKSSLESNKMNLVQTLVSSQINALSTEMTNMRNQLNSDVQSLRNEITALRNQLNLLQTTMPRVNDPCAAGGLTIPIDSSFTTNYGVYPPTVQIPALNHGQNYQTPFVFLTHVYGVKYVQARVVCNNSVRMITQVQYRQCTDSGRQTCSLF